jgi:hypothetical protein
VHLCPVQTNLTPSRKKRARSRRRNAAALAAVEWEDGLARCHARLSALAGLMVTCGEAMEASHVREIGTIITEEMCCLEKLKGTLEAAR